MEQAAGRGAAQLRALQGWLKRTEPSYDGGHIDVLMERYHGEVTRYAMEERRSKVTVHRGDSLEVATRFDDGYFDMIYIDADHRYDGVLADLFAYAPKLKRGGIVMGDDFLEDLSRKDGFYGTIEAVSTFVKRTDFRCLAILGTSETQFMLHREMSPYVDRFLTGLFDSGKHIVEVNDALAGRFVQKTIRTSRSQETVASFL